MKKIDFKSVVIGFSSCIVLLLIFGFNTSESDISGFGKYQGWGEEGKNFMINTETGELYTTSIVINKLKWRKLTKEDL